MMSSAHSRGPLEIHPGGPEVVCRCFRAFHTCRTHPRSCDIPGAFLEVLEAGVAQASARAALSLHTRFSIPSLWKGLCCPLGVPCGRGG